MKQLTAKDAEIEIVKECNRVKLDTNKVKRIIKNMKQLVKSSNKDQLSMLIAFQIAMLQNSRIILHQKLRTGLWTPPPNRGTDGLIKPKA